MNPSGPDIKIQRIYSADPRRAATVSTKELHPSSKPKPKIQPPSGPPRPLAAAVFGLVTLLIAGAWIYMTWWPVDRLFEKNISSIVMGQGLGAFSQFLGGLEENPVQSLDTSMRIGGQLGGLMYGWLVLATLAGGLLVAAAMGHIARYQAAPTRRRVLLLASLMLVAVLFYIGLNMWQLTAKQTLLDLPKAFQPWMERGAVALGLIACALAATSLRPRFAGLLAVLLAVVLVGGWVLWCFNMVGFLKTDTPRVGALLILLTAAMIGVAATRKAANVLRWAIRAVLVVAIATPIALFWADRLGGVQTHQLVWSYYLIIFVVMLIPAAVLLIGGRLART